MSLLRKLFAPKEQVWQPFCEGIGGRYIEGGFWKGDRIEIPHQAWTITLRAERDSESSHDSTSLRAEVDLVSGQMLGLLRNWPGQQMMNMLASMLGLQTAVVPGLSKEYLILAKDQRQAEAFFGDERLLELIQQQKQLMIFIGIARRLSRPAGTKELHVAVPELVKQLPRLESLVDLSRRAIDTLSENRLMQSAVRIVDHERYKGPERPRRTRRARKATKDTKG